MDGPEIARLYYSTHDVCRMFDLPPHQLRMWERRFSMLKPSKSKSGRRLYRPLDVKWVGWIKRMKEHGYTDEKILCILNESEKAPQNLPAVKKPDLTIHAIKLVLVEILDILDGKPEEERFSPPGGFPSETPMAP